MKSSIALLFLLLLSTSIFAQESCSWQQTVTLKIDSIIANHPMMQRASCGMIVYDAVDDTVIYQHEAQKIHRPASTTKLFTCASALHYLTSQHAFRTSVFYTGKIKKKHGKRTLRGDIFVKGNFDPSFSSADMDTLIMTIQQKGIDSIAGNIYADLSMKSRIKGGFGWCWDDTGDDFPFLSPLIVDKDTTFLTCFYTQLQQNGIGIKGTLGDSIVPTKTKLLAEKCCSLHDLMPHCLKTSDNRYAESFLYQLGTLSGELYPKTNVSIALLDSFIMQTDSINHDDFRFVDGSGLSFYNYVTPQIEVALLKHVYKHTDFYEELKQALPIAGVDGTLRNRMKNTPAYQHVFAKTGSLTGSYALAGYADGGNGHLLIFSIMNDGVTAGKGNNIRAMQDDILSVLCSQ